MKRLLERSVCWLVVAVCVLAFPVQADAAWKSRMILSLNGLDGKVIEGGVTADAKGNLYGAGFSGGTHNAGTVFRLAPPAAGKSAWTVSTLASMVPGLTATGINLGQSPKSTPVIDRSGNVYGTNSVGGGVRESAFGMIYRLTPPASGKGTWVETQQYYFSGKSYLGKLDALHADTEGNIYGTAFFQQANPYLPANGAIYQLTPSATSKKLGVIKIIALFAPSAGATVSVQSHSFVFDKHGNIYGATSPAGNVAAYVFRLTKPAKANGAWTKTVLASFPNQSQATRGVTPTGLAFDPQGNLYGVADGGGPNGGGVVFKLTPPASGVGSWTETVLASFDSFNLGISVYNLAADAKGNLFVIGGDYNNFDEDVFEVSPPVGGATAWSVATIASYPSIMPYAPSPPVVDAKGNVFGVVEDGGTYGFGTVFELSPQ